MRIAWLGTWPDGAFAATLMRALGEAGIESEVVADVARALPADAVVCPVPRAAPAVPQPVLYVARDDEEERRAHGLARPIDDVARSDDLVDGIVQRARRMVARASAAHGRADPEETDALTGLANRRGGMRRMKQWLDALSPDAVHGVFLLDIDHFKRINDQHGHAAGDEVLQQVARTLARTLGGSAPLARWGGEAFGWVCSGVDAAALAGQAELVLEQLRLLAIRIDPGSITVSASIGWSRIGRGAAIDDVLREADQALYDAKARGRDRVRSWQDLHQQAVATDGDVQLTHFQNVAQVVGERATSLVTLFGKGLVEQARRAADQDRMTQIWNRGYFDRRLPREMALSREDGRPLSIAIMDLDHFGQFNKTWGLPTGDAVLRQVTAVAGGCIRAVDWLARYGGEEFVLVMPATLEVAAVTAERIREAVAATRIESPLGTTVTVTVSIGVAQLDASIATPIDLVQRASDALQQAKRAGRNRIAR